MSTETTTRYAPSGQQYEIASGDQSAVVVEVGGGIREYHHGERPVLDPYPVDAMADGAHGAPLIPWPNRLGDGRYRFDGQDYRAALTEPDKGNAIHGLLLWQPWLATDRQADEITMRTRVHPQTGYPFALGLMLFSALGPMWYFRKRGWLK